MATKRNLPAQTEDLFGSLVEESEGFDVSDLLEEGAFIDDKNVLVGVPFVILGWSHTSKNLVGVRVDIVLANNDRASFVDFSTGIRNQLERVTRKLNGDAEDAEIPDGFVMKPARPLYFPHGLRVSVYQYKDDLAGTMVPAETFYLNPQK
jgi:hypothetical protein